MPCSLCTRRDSGLLLFLEGTLDLIALFASMFVVFMLKSAGIFSCDLTYVVCNSKIMCPRGRNRAWQHCGALPYLAQY